MSKKSSSGTLINGKRHRGDYTPKPNPRKEKLKAVREARRKNRV